MAEEAGFLEEEVAAVAAVDGRGPRVFHVFYDGDCGFCDRSVHFLVTRYRGTDAGFAPIGGATWQRLLGGAEDFESVVVLRRDGRMLLESDAVLYLMYKLGGNWRLLARLGFCVPSLIRNAFYRLVARVRRLIVRGAPGRCALLPKEKRALFLP